MVNLFVTLQESAKYAPSTQPPCSVSFTFRRLKLFGTPRRKDARELPAVPVRAALSVFDEENTSEAFKYSALALLVAKSAPILKVWRPWFFVKFPPNFQMFVPFVWSVGAAPCALGSMLPMNPFIVMLGIRETPPMKPLAKLGANPRLVPVAPDESTKPEPWEMSKRTRPK